LSFTDFLENKVLGHVFGGAAYTAPATLYVALFSAAPGETGGGTELTSGTAAGYARKAITPSTQMAVSGTNPTQVANSVDLDFIAATADWPAVTHAAIFDASTAGNMLDQGPLTVARSILSGDVFRFPAGSLKITLD
jgi:hypothetical protein